MLLNKFIETRGLKQDFENLTASQTQSSEPATSVAGDGLKSRVLLLSTPLTMVETNSRTPGGDDPSGSPSSSSVTTQPVLTVVVAFEGESHHFDFVENKCNVMNLAFRTAMAPSRA